jgi:uncharacterized protein YciW
LNDVTEAILGLAPGSPVAKLRHERESVLTDTQGAYDALFHPKDPGNIPSATRLAMGLRVAEREHDTVLAHHFRAELAKASPSPDDEAKACLLKHVDLVTNTPDAAGTNMQALRALGFNSRDIVAATQLIAFATFHIRVLAGLRLLQEEAA